MYKIGRDVTIDEVTEDRTVISVIGPAAARSRSAGRPAPEHAHRAATVGGVECIAAATDLGVDLHCAARRAARGARRAGRRGRRAGRRRGGRDRPGRGRQAALRARDDDRDDPRRRRGSTSARSASPRAATSARRRSPACTTRASRTATCAACGSSAPVAAGDPVRLGERELGDGRHRRPLPRSRADRARDPAPRGRAGRPRLRSARAWRPRSSSSRSRRPKRHRAAAC